MEKTPIFQRECVNNHVQNVGRNRDLMGDLADISDGPEERVIKQWIKVSPNHKVAKSLA